MKAKPKTAVTSRDIPEPAQEHSYSAFDNMLEGVQVLAHDWRYIYLNEAAERHNHRPNQELLGNQYMDMWPGIEDTHVFSLIKHCMEECVASRLENRFIYPDGAVGWFNLSIQPIPEGVLILSFDTTERVSAQRQVTQMKRLYATLSQVNQTIVRVKSRDELYRSICNVAVRFGEFSLAWIGLLDETTGEVCPVAANGLDVAQWPFEFVNITDGTYKDGLIATAIRTSRLVTTEDLETDERTQSQYEELEKYAFHSLAVIPFQLRGKTIGALNLVSHEIGLFKDADEVRLLDEMGVDISFALDTMETEAERTWTENALRERWVQYQTLFESNPNPMWVYDLDTLAFLMVNDAAIAHYGYSRDEFLGMTLRDIRPIDDLPILYDILADESSSLRRTDSVRHRKKDGTLITVEVVTHTLQWGHRQARLVLANDVTERKQAEEALQQSEERYRSLFENMIEGYAYCQMLYQNGQPCDWTYISVNEAFEKLTGLKDVIGKRVTEIIPNIREADPTLFEIYSRVARTGQPEKFELFVHALQMWFSISVYSPGREFFVAVFDVITERKRADEALRQSEERFRSLYENATIGIYRTTPEGQILLANPALVNMLGYASFEELAQRNLEEQGYEPGYQRGEFRQQIETDGKVRGLESAWTRKDGSTIFVRESATVARDGEGRIIYYEGTVEDITVRKQAEEALRQSEERFRVLVDQVSNIAVQGYAADGTVRFWNKASEKIYGYTAEEALGKNLLDLIIPPPMRQAVIEDIGQMVQSGEGRTGEELLLMRKDGSLVPVYSNHTVIEVHGGGKELYCIDIDLTERKQAEKALQESERQMRALVTSLDDIVIEFDEEGTYVNIWAADENLLARPKDQLLGQPLVAVIGQEVGRQHLEAIRRVLTSGTSEIIEYPLTVLGGQRWFMARVSSLSSQNSTHRTVVMLIRDITQRKQSDNELLHQKELLQTIVDNIPVMIEFNDSDGQIRWVNRHWTHILGWSQEEANRRDILSKLYPDAKDYQNVLKFIKTGSGVWADFRTRTKDGQRIDASWANVILSNGTSIGIGQDVTERRLAEQEIQRRNEDLALINALNAAANRGEDIERIAEVFAREAQSVLACQDVALYLLSPDSKYLEMQSSTLPRGLSESIEKLIGRPIPKIRIALKEGSYFKKILANEAGVITSDPAVIQQWIEEFTETTFLPHVFRAPIRALIPQIYRLLNISSAISIPLITSGRAIGILDMSSKGQFTEEDLRRVRNLSYQMTAVILRKQAEKQVQFQLQRMRAVNEIDGAINSSMDIRVSLDILLTQVISQLSVHAASVLLFDTSTNTLQNVAAKGFRTADVRQSQTKLGEGLAGKVGLERSVLHVQNPAQAEGQLKRAELIRHEEFVEYVGVPLVAKGVLKGVLEIFHRTSLSPDTEWMNYLRTLGEQAAIAIDNTQLFEGMQRSNLELITAYDATIDGWSRAMDLRDRETEGHTQRVTDLTLSLARTMGISQQELIHIRRGALLHDMGKLGVPDYILHKPGELTAKEWEIMHQHPNFALNMLLPIHYLRPALDIPYCHHEKWDGTGYPRGLKGGQIPLAARIFAVVDVWDALTSDRPYRPAWSTKKALEYIKEESGLHFDPEVVKAFLKIPDIR